MIYNISIIISMSIIIFIIIIITIVVVVVFAAVRNGSSPATEYVLLSRQ